MDLKWLEDFLCLAETQSFSRAAEERHITQSALSKRIRSLESWVGADLVDRSMYPTRLTPAGKLFRNHAQEFLKGLLDSRALIRGQHPIRNGALLVAAGHTLSLNFFPAWLHNIHATFGEFKTRVVASNVHDSVLELVDGSCDLLLCYQHPELPITLDPDRYAHIVLGTDTLIPVCTPNAQGNPNTSLPGTKLKPIRQLAYTKTSYFGRAIDLLLSKLHTPCHVETFYESDMAELLKKIALEGYGLAWLPKSSILKELANQTLVPAGETQWHFKLEIWLFRDLQNKKPALDRLWNFLSQSSPHNADQ